MPNTVSEGTALCYAERIANRWTAHCLTFDLVVEGGSLNEVRSKLSDQIELYLEGVSSLPLADQRRLIGRRAPLSAFLKLFFHVFQAAIATGSRLRSDYTEPFRTGSAGYSEAA